MTWEEFVEKYHFRTVEKCCENCKHGLPDYDSECVCEHPLLDDESDFPYWNDVCDLWEGRDEGKGGDQ